MRSRFRKQLLRFIGLTLLIGALGSATTFAATPQKMPMRPRVHLSFPFPVIRTSVAGPRSNSAKKYTITDLGAPPATTFPYSVPVAFNNSGQILGQADAATGVIDCMLYVGMNKFVDVSASAANTDCEPRGLNTAGASKELNFVGSIFTIFGDGPVALVGKAAAATGVGTVSAYTSHVPSNFYGVNSTGQVIGDSYYLPFSGGSYLPEFVLDSGASNLSLAQPQCSGLAVNCGTDDYYGVCRFGGCYINDKAVVLAYDSTSARLVTYNVSTPKTVEEIPTVGGALITNAPVINNLSDIEYTSTDSSAVHATTYFYSTSLGKTTTLPTFSKNTCTQYVAISMNNLGEILGYTANCQAATDQLYWTWTAGGGLQNLTAQLPSNSYALIAPLAVNDAGNILLGLETTTGTIHWGLLNLITSSVSRSP